MPSPARLTAALVAGALLVAGCSDVAPVAPAPVWHEVALPSAGPGRVELRAVAACGARRYAVGAREAADGATSPAAWSSSDGRSWAALPLRPSSAYGPAHVLTAIACLGDEAVAIGSAPGGVHGNLRTATWYSPAPAGPLGETPAAFELYGGPAAIGVGGLAAGPRGWVVEGAREGANGSAGAAAWAAADGRSFRLVDADPALESDARGQTSASGVTVAPDGTFVIVGSLLPPSSPGLARRPLAWTSPDGVRWRRESVPTSAGADATIERAARDGDGVLAVGLRGGGFGAWRRDGRGWHDAGRFGTLTGTEMPQVTGLAAGPGGARYAVTLDGARYRLWGSADARQWRELPLPAAVTGGRGRTVVLTGDGTSMLLATDDGVTARLWSAG